MPEISPDARVELAPTGRLRAAIAVGDAASAVWNVRDPATGEPRGVAVDLAHALATRLELELELAPYSSSAAIVAAAGDGAWDIGFTPVDAERKKSVAFTTDYYRGVSTYMVRAGFPAASVADVDATGSRIAGVEGTATLRAARAVLTRSTAQGYAKLDELLELFARGEVDAVALGRESIVSLLPRFPGARVLDDHFLATGTAIALPPGRPLALDLVTRELEALRADGTLRVILDRNGLADAAVPPANARS